MKLYDYQEIAVDTVLKHWTNGLFRGVLNSPTSSGKTVIAASLINKFVKKGNKVLFLVHLENLIDSTFIALNGLGVKGLGKITAKTKNIKPAMVNVAMVQTFKSRLKSDKNKSQFIKLLKEVTFIVFDEIHLNFFNEFLVNPLLQEKYMLGMSATPKRSGAKNPQLATLFQFKVDTITEIELIKRGKAVPPYFVTPKETDINLEHVKISKLSGESDYNSDDLFKQLDKRQIYNNAVGLWQKYAKGLQTLVFTANLEHAIKTCLLFNEAGIKAKFLTSEPKKPRPIQKDYSQKLKKREFYINNYQLYSDSKEKLLNQWNKKEFDVLINVRMLTTGYDNNKILSIMLMVATLSENLYLQMCGRGKRTAPEIDKKEYVYIDLGDNTKHFGSPTQPRNYTLTHSTKKGSGEAPTKICPKCNNKIYASSRVCGKINPRNLKICTHIFEVKKETVSGDFKAISLLDMLGMPYQKMIDNFDKIDVLEIENIQKKRKYQDFWTYHKINDSQGEHGLIEFAIKKGYEPEKFLEEISKKINIKVLQNS